MSHEATNWAVKLRGLRPIVKIVLWHLADCHNPTMGCFPTQEYLADRAEISRASVNRVLDELETAGVIRREQQVDPETKRQRPTRYRLAFEEGFEPLDVASRVSGSDTAKEGDPSLKSEPSRVSESEVSVSHSYETLTSKGTGKGNQETPQPPLAGGPSFAELVKEWPNDHLGNFDNARGAFERLTSGEQTDAIRLASTVATAFARRKDRIPALVRYVRERMFVEFDGAPDVDEDGRFIITPDRPEWREWLGDIRRQHGQRGVDSIVKAKRFLPLTRWPGKAAESRAA